MNNKITIVIPTYKRPILLERALNSVISDHYKFDILVSVNGKDECYEEYKITQKKFEVLKNVKFFYQETNIGFFNNLNFLISECKTEYISILADDDESDVEGIVTIRNFLAENNDFVSGCLFWEFISSDGSKKLLKPRCFHQDYILKRILSYLYSSDDAFFYGLHRTSSLRKCSFKSYWRPNQRDLANWAYVFQFDLLLQGKIYFLNQDKYKWKNHDYTKKYYHKPKLNFFIRGFKYIFRRINIYFMYLKKILLTGNFLIFPIVLLYSILFLVRDIVFREPIYHILKSKVKNK